MSSTECEQCVSLLANFMNCCSGRREPPLLQPAEPATTLGAESSASEPTIQVPNTPVPPSGFAESECTAAVDEIIMKHADSANANPLPLASMPSIEDLK